MAMILDWTKMLSGRLLALFCLIYGVQQKSIISLVVCQNFTYTLFIYAYIKMPNSLTETKLWNLFMTV